MFPFQVHAVGRGAVDHGTGAAFDPLDISPDLYLDASDLSTLFQSNAGSTAVAADGDRVGHWGDKSGNGFHLTSVADDTTRPRYKTDGSKHWIEFNGSSEWLRRLAALSLYDIAGGWQIFMAVNATNATAFRYPITEVMSTNTSQRLIIAAGATAATLDLYRNPNTGGLNATLAASGWAASDQIIGVQDNNVNSAVGYIDQAAQTPQAYGHNGAITPDRFSLGAWWNATTGTAFFAMKLYALVAKKGAILGTTDRQNLITWLAAKQGRSI